MRTFLSIRVSCILAGVVFLLACEKGLDYELPYEGDRLVLFGLLDPAQEIRMHVSHTTAPIGPRPDTLIVEDATLLLYEGTNPPDTLVYADSGYYVLPTPRMPRVGVAYRLEASAPGYPDAYTASVTIPELVPVDRYVLLDSSTGSGNSAYSAGTLDLVFTDPPALGDHYRIQIRSFLDTLADNTYFWLLGQPYSERDPCYFDWGGAFHLTDACFTQAEQALQLGLETSFSNPDNWREILKPQRIEVYLQVITEAYYGYERSLIQPSGFETAFTDPVPLRSNVTGGYGVLGAVNTTVVTIEF